MRKREKSQQEFYLEPPNRQELLEQAVSQLWLHPLHHLVNPLPVTGPNLPEVAQLLLLSRALNQQMQLLFHKMQGGKLLAKLVKLETEVKSQKGLGPLENLLSCLAAELAEMAKQVEKLQAELVLEAKRQQVPKQRKPANKTYPLSINPLL